MTKEQIVNEISQLKIDEIIHVIERSLSKISSKTGKEPLELAAEIMSKEYKQNKEMSAFNELDLEDFYEAK